MMMRGLAQEKFCQKRFFCRPVCNKDEFYCSRKTKLNFIDQRVVISHVLFILSHYTGKTSKVHLPCCLESTISTSEAHISSSFASNFQSFELKFGEHVPR